MNGIDILRAMNRLDDRFVISAKRERIVKRNKIASRFAIGILAAALLVTSAIGVYAAGLLDLFRQYFKGDTTPFESELIETVDTVSNDDITLTIEGIVADNAEGDILISVYAKSDRGRRIVKDLRKGTGSDPHGTPQLFLEHYGYNDESGYSFEEQRSTYLSLNNAEEYHELKKLDMSKVDTEKGFKLTESESGLSTEFYISPYIKSLQVVSDDENAYDNVTVSELGLHIMSTPHDIANGRNLHGNVIGSEIYVNYSDGDSIKLTAMYADERQFTDDEIKSEDYERLTENGKVIVGESLKASYLVDETEAFISLDGIESVTINGIEYTIME